MRDEDLLTGTRPRQRRVEPVAFDGDPPQLRKHEQGLIHTVGLVAMCAPFLLFAMHIDPPEPDQKPAGPPTPPAVAAKAVPSTPLNPASADSDNPPTSFDEHDESRVVLRRILFVPTDDQPGSDSMDVLYDVTPDQKTVEIEHDEPIRGSVDD